MHDAKVFNKEESKSSAQTLSGKLKLTIFLIKKRINEWRQRPSECACNSGWEASLSLRQTEAKASLPSLKTLIPIWGLRASGNRKALLRMGQPWVGGGSRWCVAAQGHQTRTSTRTRTKSVPYQSRVPHKLPTDSMAGATNCCPF